MRWNVFLLFLFSLFLLLAGLSSQSIAQEKMQFNAVYGQGDQVLRIATGSPGALGLLKEIGLPPVPL